RIANALPEDPLPSRRRPKHVRPLARVLGPLPRRPTLPSPDDTIKEGDLPPSSPRFNGTHHLPSVIIADEPQDVKVEGPAPELTERIRREPSPPVGTWLSGPTVVLLLAFSLGVFALGIAMLVLNNDRAISLGLPAKVINQR